MKGSRRIRRRNASPCSFARDIEILAPTLLEYWAIRCTLPSTRVHWAGVSLRRWQGMHQTSSVIVCGLAGALTTDLASGTVLIPDRVSLVNGKEMSCDPLLVQILISAARTLHMPLKTGPLLTTPSLTVGKARLYWAQQGFVAADMETGLLLEQNPRVATIRVILDSPKHDLSSSWLQPGSALMQPQVWKQLFWLSWIAPRYAFQAARVLKAGLGFDPASVSLDFTKEKK